MNRETETIIARLHREIKELEEERDAILFSYNQADRECARLRELISGAASVLEKWNIKGRWSDIIAELRKAAQ